MGLDAVELVMAIEEEFGIQIPDSEAEKMQRVGDVFKFVVKRVHEQTASQIDEGIIWTRLKDIIVAQLAVRPEEVTPAAHFIDGLRMD